MSAALHLAHIIVFFLLINELTAYSNLSTQKKQPCLTRFIAPGLLTMMGELSEVQMTFFYPFNERWRWTTMTSTQVVHVQERPVLIRAMDLCVSVWWCLLPIKEPHKPLNPGGPKMEISHSA